MAAASSFATGKERRDDVFPKQPVVLRANHLGNLILELRRQGYEVVGPTVRDGAIIYDHIGSPEDLPVGWTDEQKPGHYRLFAVRRSDLFWLCDRATKLEEISSSGRGATVLGRAPGEDVSNPEQ